MAYATAILIAILILYCFMISRFRYSWDITPSFPDPELLPSVRISVITAFRNETKNLPVLLDALGKQNYPVGLYEIILVDDGSDDGSEKLARLFSIGHPQFRYILNTGQPGKKHAIQTGIHVACGELIVMTDADCKMEPGWLSGVASFFVQQHPELIIGLVDRTSSESWLNSYEQASFLSLVAAGSGAACAGRPLYCNGANMAFTRELYNSLSDPMMDSVPSGDDTFLLHAVKRAGKKISLLKSSKTLVTTAGASSWHALIRQRIRWTSKAGHYTDAQTIYSAILVLVMNLCIPATALIYVFTGKPWLFLALFGAKAVTDYGLLNSYMKFLGHTLSPLRFLVFSLLYPLEVIVSVFAGLTLSFRWKGREYRK